MSVEMSARERLIRDFVNETGGEAKKSTGIPKPPKAPLITEKIDVTGNTTIGDLTGDSTSKFSTIATHKFSDDDWPEFLRPYIPAIDKNFVPSDQFYRMWVAADQGFNLFVWGPSGSGKDKSFVQYCAYKRIPYRRITGMDGMLPDTAIGHNSLNDKGMFFQPGDAYNICRYGGMLVLSEPAAMPRVMFALQSALEDGGHLSIPDHPDEDSRMLPVHKNAMFVATSNVRGVGDNRGKHSATSIMDSSTINRFQCTLHFPYMDSATEKKVLKNHFPTVKDEMLDKVIALSNLIRDAVEKRQIKADWSLRTSLPWIRMSLIYGDMAEGFKSTYYDKLDDAEKGAVRGFWDAVDIQDKL